MYAFTAGEFKASTVVHTALTSGPTTLVSILYLHVPDTQKEACHRAGNRGTQRGNGGKVVGPCQYVNEPKGLHENKTTSDIEGGVRERGDMVSSSTAHANRTYDSSTDQLDQC